MSIQFRDLSGDGGLGDAGFLRFIIDTDNNGLRGALFSVNARGEPVDFSFSRVDVPSSFLWRAGDARRHAVTALSRSLFSACSTKPTVLLTLADEVPPLVFTEDIQVAVPLCRIATSALVINAPAESIEKMGEALNLFWASGTPAEGSESRQLIDALHSRQLLMEPFERAAIGLDEAFKAG